MRNRIEYLIVLKRFALFLAVWLVLTGGRADGIGFGVAAAAGAAWISRRLLHRGEPQLLLLKLLALAPHFLARSLSGGIDVARRAFDPRLPLRPGWIRYRTRLPAGAPRVILGGEISLLPGTLVAGCDEEGLLVHCLDAGQPVERQIREEEERLEAALGPPAEG